MDDLIDEEMEPVFRGKCKLLGRWMYGNYYKKKDGRVYINSTEVDPKTVSQFIWIYDDTPWIGLTLKEQTNWLKSKKQTDWKGRMIFGKDLVSIVQTDGYQSKYTGEVRFHKTRYRLYLGQKSYLTYYDFNKKESDNDGHCTITWVNLFRVIGNSIDNPEVVLGPIR